MRVLVLILGMTTVTCATAGEFDSRLHDADALTGQLVYEARFGAAGAPMSSAFRLQFANEGQRLSGYAPLKAEFRPGSGEILVNGVNVERVLIARQDGDGSGISRLWNGWLPLVIVIGAAGLILVDGNDQDFSGGGTGGS